ncbi:hypothetical protein M3Y94_01073900 [Aphelenchoides besseyi]|nr:hypothetical protein M3Y94_01073900 [Aphelenchoides besseyi]
MITRLLSPSNRTFFSSSFRVRFQRRSIASTAKPPGTFTFVPANRTDDKNEEPLIVFLGFGGARDNVMEKYSNIYVDQNYARARFSPEFPKANSLVAYRPHAEFLYDQLHEKCPQLESRPIIFHMFSQTGVRIFVSLWDLIAAKNGRLKNSQTRGLIFDSCPADVQPYHVGKTLARVNYPLKKYSRLHHYAAFVIATAVLQLHRFGILLEALRDPKARSRHFAFERLKELDNLPNKQMYLYAENDDLCMAKEIRQYAKKQKDSGVEVTEQCWPDSGHCRHYVRYPEEYKRLCLEFAKSVFE